VTAVLRYDWHSFVSASDFNTRERVRLTGFWVNQYYKDHSSGLKMGRGARYFDAGNQTSDSKRRAKFLYSPRSYRLLKQNSSAVS